MDMIQGDRPLVSLAMSPRTPSSPQAKPDAQSDPDLN